MKLKEINLYIPGSLQLSFTLFNLYGLIDCHFDFTVILGCNCIDDLMHNASHQTKNCVSIIVGVNANKYSVSNA